MEIDALHTFIRFLTKKARSGYFTPEELDDALNWASLDLFNELYGLRNAYQPGRAVPLNGYEITQKNKDDLRVFMTNPTTLSLISGVATLPPDYIHWSMINTTNNGVTKEVKVIDDARWNFRINRITAKPSTNNPVCRIYNTQVEFNPTTLADVKLTYLKEPTKAVWAYTTVNNRPVFDVGNSVDFEWGEENHMDLITRALTFLGVNLEAQDIKDYTTIRKQSGV